MVDTINYSISEIQALVETGKINSRKQTLHNY